jgi:phosphoribosyl 1,2-cyclic phosphodiesterase
MELLFLGTRGEIEARSKRHRNHSSLLVTDGIGRRIMIDCGDDWKDQIKRVAPDSIVLTHAHQDHAAGLKDGAPCPVFATNETWERLKRYAISDPRVIFPYRPFHIGSTVFEAIPVEHSLRAPAVGFRLRQHQGNRIFYVPDVASITNSTHVLSRTTIYIGDGATILRPILRKRGDVFIGHASMATQLKWCREAGVAQVIFTHCGSQIVGGDDQKASGELRELGRHYGIEVRLAYDGLRISV